jgi:hypothetical protein
MPVVVVPVVVIVIVHVDDAAGRAEADAHEEGNNQEPSKRATHTSSALKKPNFGPPAAWRH